MARAKVGGSSTLLGRASRGECKSRLRIKAFAAEHDSLGVGMRKKAKGRLVFEENPFSG